MKEKLSVTMERPLVRFLDSLPGESRSQKLEQVVRRFKDVTDDLALRRALTAHRDSEEEQRAHKAWLRTTEEAMWREE